MAVGFFFWLITRKKAKEQQAGKKQYLWIAELVAAGAATIICGAAVIRTAIPYNGALSWKIYEWRRINDESSSKDNSDTNKEENEPEIFSGTETETETKTSENIRNSDTWEFNAEDGDMYYFINDITGYRLPVEAAFITLKRRRMEVRPGRRSTVIRLIRIWALPKVCSFLRMISDLQD